MDGAIAFVVKNLKGDITIMPETATPIPMVKRNIEKIQENLYSVEVNFRGFSRNFSLDWVDLGFSDEVLANLKESKFKIKGVPIFNKLTEKAKKLISLRHEFEHKRTISIDGQKLITESQFEAALKDIVYMKEVADQCRQELTFEREEGLAALKEKVTKFLSQFEISEAEISYKLLQIEAEFPSESEIQNLLIIESKYTRIMGLAEQLKSDLEDEKLLNLKLEREALQELRRSKQEQVNKLMALKDKIFQEAEKIVLQILSEQLERLEKLELGENNKCVRNRMEKHLEKIEAILDLDLTGNFGQVQQEITNLHKFLVQTVSYNPQEREKIEQRFNELKEELNESYNDIIKATAKTKKIRKSGKLAVA